MEEILIATGGVLLAGPRQGRIHRLCTDSRKVQPGDLFIALKGPHFDGHRFVPEAFKQGALGAVVEESSRGEVLATAQKVRSSWGIPTPLVICVGDTLVAYQEMAAYHRRRFQIPVVAVTGSNGKTTTKEMVAAALKTRWRVLKTLGNLNNSIGLPQTLLGLTRRHDVAVIEMGVDQKGQTTRLCEIARPTLGVVTNIGPDHLEFFGSIEGSALAKAELLACLPSDGTIVINADDAYYDFLKNQARCRVVSFGLSARAQIRGSHVVPQGNRTAFRVRVPGRARAPQMSVGALGTHNVSNALAAVAVGHVLGLSLSKIAGGLGRFRPADMRSQIRWCKGIRVLHDCYNANPVSMRAAVDLLVELGAGKRTVAVMGDMLELGPDAKRLHREVGGYLAGRQVSYLIACGELGREFAKGARAAGMARRHIFETKGVPEASELLNGLVRKGDVVLLKASRAMRMEQLLDGLSAMGKK